MVVGYLSPLLMDWTLAVTELNTSNAHKLLEKEPELLWTPIPHALDDTDHLLNELVELKKLGSSFQPVSAIQFTLLQYRENSQDSIQLDRFKFLTYLIEQSSLHDLDTRFWGENNNSTLHLVCFLGQQNIIQLLISKGVSITPMNGLGFLPKDVTSSEFIIQSLSKVQKKENVSRSKSTVVRPNYSTPDRFKLLRDLAEESSVIGDDNNKKVQHVTIERKQSEIHYFRKGRVKETQQKVLIEEEVEKQNLKRQLEVAQLVKKSAVKNNPLWKKMEKVTFITSPTPSPSTSSNNQSTQQQLIEDSLKQEIEDIVPEIKPKRNSKVISSLQKNSYVSSSIFVQADEPATTTTRSTCVTKQNNLDNETQSITIYSTEPNEIEHEDIQHIEKSSSDQSSDEDDCYFETESNNNDILTSQIDTISISSSSNQSETLNHTFSFSSNEDIVAPLNHTFSISSSEDITLTKNVTSISSDDDDNYKQETYNHSTHTTSSEDYSDDENDDDDDDEYGEATPVQFATRLITPVYKSAVMMNEEKFEMPKSKSDTHYFNDEENNDIKPSSAHEEILIPNTPTSVEPTSPVRPQRSDLRKATLPLIVDVESKEKKRMSGSQKATWTMSMSSWAAILDREFNLDELDQQKKVRERQQSLQSEKIEEEDIITINRFSTATVNLLDDKLQLSDDEKIQLPLQPSPPLPNSCSLLSLNTTQPIRSSSMISFQEFEAPTIPSPNTVIKSTQLLPKKVSKPPQIAELPKLNSSKSISRKPIVASISETNITKKNITTKHQHTVPSSRTIQVQQRRLQHGKLYLHVNGIQDILLPLPKDRAYVRCVVSDGKFEYMSRYEILSQNINFDYECVIDTHPDMIITISLHVRPDYVMKSKTPFSRLFSSKKKKESLSGYVNKEDGAIGQARFALAHMLPVCVETTYPAEFHCFNAWYSRSFKERHRQKKKDPDQDVLKVVGNFDVAMLYLPIQDLQKPFPRNLRECDAAIKRLHKSVEESSEKYHTF